jgi:hypothetical protein
MTRDGQHGSQDGDTFTRGEQTNPSELSGVDVLIDITTPFDVKKSINGQST